MLECINIIINEDKDLVHMDEEGEGECMDEEGECMDEEGECMDEEGECMDEEGEGEGMDEEGECMDEEGEGDHVNQITMEIESIELNGNYCYAPDFEIMSYDDKCEKCTECAFCKRNLYEYSYNIITDNKSILNDNKVIIGKCGHMFHKDCMDSWLKHGNTICPIDKVTWEEYRIADNYTALPIINKKKHNNKYKFRYNKVCKYNN
jgi:hypothetical protein